MTARTVFDKTRTPLRIWLAAIRYVVNQKQGVTALGLKRVLGLGSYQTAWAMLHRLRRAMIRPGRERLHGVVEVDESFIGRSRPNKTRDTKQTQSSKIQRSLVMIAVEIKEPKGFGRIRLQRVTNRSEQAVLPFVLDSVEPGSIVRTDGSEAYRNLSKHGYQREKTVMLGADDPAHVAMPGVHRVAALLKRWLLGTHQGAVQPKQLGYYLDEFTFRFNRRTSRSRGLLFYRMLQQALVTEPVTYAQIVGKDKHNIQGVVELSGYPLHAYSITGTHGTDNTSSAQRPGASPATRPGLRVGRRPWRPPTPCPSAAQQRCTRPLARFGHHVARYEDAALVIESSQLLANLASGGGNALSDQTTTVETYRRVDDPKVGPMIQMIMEISDPGHLTGQWIVSWLKIFDPDGLDFIEVDCRLPLSPGS